MGKWKETVEDTLSFSGSCALFVRTKNSWQNENRLMCWQQRISWFVRYFMTQITLSQAFAC